MVARVADEDRVVLEELGAVWIVECFRPGLAADRPEDLPVPVGLDDQPERRVGDQQVAVREQADVVGIVERQPPSS